MVCVVVVVLVVLVTMYRQKLMKGYPIAWGERRADCNTIKSRKPEVVAP